MDATLLHREGDLRTFALVMAEGDDPCAEILALAEAEGITAAVLSGIGGCRSATVGYFDPEIDDYRNAHFDEHLEVLSLLGDIATQDGEPALHAQVVLARRNYVAVGGHLRHAEVHPTLEVVLEETPAHLRKRIDPGTGLALLALDGAE